MFVADKGWCYYNFLYSSEDEGCTVNGSGRVSEKQDADLSGEDEFEKEMDSEAIATLRLMVSPTAAAQAAKSHVTRATPLAIDKPLTAKPSRALAKARQRRGSNEQQRKTVTFAADANTEDMDNGPRAGLILLKDCISLEIKCRIVLHIVHACLSELQCRYILLLCSGQASMDHYQRGYNTITGYTLETGNLTTISIFPMLAPNGPEPMTQSEEKTQEPEYYDDIYFDSSGSEDERGESEGIRKVGKKVRKMTNEELFYDPKMDEEDEKWMKRQRMTYLSGEIFSIAFLVETNGQEYDCVCNIGYPVLHLLVTVVKFVYILLC